MKRYEKLTDYEKEVMIFSDMLRNNSKNSIWFPIDHNGFLELVLFQKAAMLLTSRKTRGESIYSLE